MDFLFESIWNVLLDSGLNGFTFQNGAMLIIGVVLLYLAIGRGFEPLLLAPIAFGCLLANLPKSGILDMNEHGVMQLMLMGLHYEIFPPIIFLGVGAMTDFRPLLSNPKTLLLGAAAQLGVFIALAGAMVMSTLSFGLIPDFTLKEAAAIGIIGGADGPTALYLAARMAPDLLPVIAVAAYSYMSLVPLIQPPVMKALTTDAERVILMDDAREVSKLEVLAFPVISTIIIGLLLPPIVPLLGMLMLGNLFRESGVTDRLSDTSQNALINTVTIFLATATGLTMEGNLFLQWSTLGVIFLGLVAFIVGTAGGVVMAKFMNIFLPEGKKINPLIGSAGVSAVPMAARVSQKVGQEYNPGNFLLMHAMGPNVAGVVGTAVAAGAMLAMLN
jgi:sodium ion-translocating decarboxylase, beta subunit